MAGALKMSLLGNPGLTLVVTMVAAGIVLGVLTALCFRVCPTRRILWALAIFAVVFVLVFPIFARA